MTSRPRVAIVDTGSGNLPSVQKALTVTGADAYVTSLPEEVRAADKVVVPGQGAFGACLAGLERDGGALRQAIVEAIKKGTPYFGICLGLQILFEGSEEDPTCTGLGVIPGKVVRFTSGPPLKIPHMGWNTCDRGPAAARTSLLAGTPSGTSFYFVHSYFPEPRTAADLALTSEHGQRFCAAVARENVFACQFHPEKSQTAGLDLLRRFVSL